MKVIINDMEGIATDLISALETLGLEVIDEKRLVADLLAANFWEGFKPSQTLLLFPGNGARELREKLSADWLQRWQWLAIGASRFWKPEENLGPAGIVENLSRIIFVKDVVILDDVISSGITCRKVRERNQVWLPGSQWHAAAPVKQASSSLKGFKSVFSAKEVGAKDCKVAINSLSTLVREPAVAKEYARRKFQGRDPDKNKFLEILNRIRE
jgi:hypothetical protein